MVTRVQSASREQCRLVLRVISPPSPPSARSVSPRCLGLVIEVGVQHQADREAIAGCSTAHTRNLSRNRHKFSFFEPFYLFFIVSH